MAKNSPSKKTSETIKSGIKKFQKLFEQAKSKDVNETDTVILVSDFFAYVLGYDKYAEITTEYAIRGTYCDLAVKINDKVKFLVEVKAIGITLKDNHLRQVVDYAAKEGVDWIILTNGAVWQVYRMFFTKPIVSELVFAVDMLDDSKKNKQLPELFYCLSREGNTKDAIGEFYRLHQATNKYAIAALMLNDSIVSSIRRELCRVHKGIKIDNERLIEIIKDAVIKRDILEDERLAVEIKRYSNNKKAKPKAITKTCEEAENTNGRLDDDGDGKEEESNTK